MYGIFLLNHCCIANINMHANTHISASKFYVDFPTGKKSLQLLQSPSCICVLRWFPLGCFTGEARVQDLENRSRSSTAQNPQDGLDEYFLACGV